MTFVKICGLSNLPTLEATVSCGARFVGFVFYPKSKRFVETEQAKILARHVPTGVQSVGLFVNPSDEDLDKVIPVVQLDMIQLHGDETTGRIAEIKEKYSLQVMKAIGLETQDDLNQIDAYESVADWLLLDKKSPQYGGTGEGFDWNILKDKKFKKPWMLAGGLDLSNIEEAMSLNPNSLDVSSGVEIHKGVKEIGKIRDFLLKVRELDKQIETD